MDVETLLSFIDSAQEESTKVYIYNDGTEILSFTLDEYYNSHIQESYKETLVSLVKSFLFDEESIVIEIR